MLTIRYSVGHNDYDLAVKYTLDRTGAKEQLFPGSVESFMQAMESQYSDHLVFICTDHEGLLTKNAALEKRIAEAKTYIAQVLDPTYAHDPADADVFTTLRKILT